MDFDPEEILPELMLVGDLLAYINVFAMVFLLGMIGRVGVLLYVLKRTVEFAISCVSGILTSLWRLDFRHRRANSAGHRNEVLAKQSKAKRWRLRASQGVRLIACMIAHSLDLADEAIE